MSIRKRAKAISTAPDAIPVAKLLLRALDAMEYVMDVRNLDCLREHEGPYHFCAACRIRDVLADADKEVE